MKTSGLFIPESANYSNKLIGEIMTEKLIVYNDRDYRKVQAELNAGKKPSKTLRFMMQALENYRQARKMGWSRSWNKDNVVNFQSFKLKDADLELRRLTLRVIEAEAQAMPAAARRFAAELLSGSQPPMGYLFFQEFTGQGQRYEGAVVSYGRINSGNRRYRDRLDLILESAVTDGCSQGLTRIRLYVDPYTGNSEPLWQGVIAAPAQPDAYRLFAELSGISWAWAEDQSRIWSHWITDYIDYFGPRQWPMQKSYFHVPGQPDCRIGASDTEHAVRDIKAA